MKPKNLHQEEGYEDVDRPLIFEWPTDFPYQGEPEYEDGPLFKDELIEKTYNPKQARWPKGMPGIGGEWKPKGAPVALNQMIQDLFAALSSDNPKSGQIAKQMQKLSTRTRWDQIESVSDALSHMTRILKSGQDIARSVGHKEIERRIGLALRRIDNAQQKTNIAGDYSVGRNIGTPSAAEQALGHKLSDEIPSETKGIPKRVVGLPEKKEETELSDLADKLRYGEEAAAPKMTLREPLKVVKLSNEAYDVRDSSQDVVGTLYADRAFAGRGSITLYSVVYLNPGDVAWRTDDPKNPLPSHEGVNLGRVHTQREALDRIRQYAKTPEGQPVLSSVADKLEEEKSALPPPTQTGQGSIYTSTDVLFRLDVAPKYATDFYAARNALASGRNFSDLTPDQREALQATLDQNVLNLIPGTPRSQQLAAISEALYDSGKKPKKGPSKLIPVPEIEFKGRGQSLNELTEEEIRDLAKGYGIYDPDASPDELVLEIDDEGPYADAEESLTNLSMTTIKAIALAYNIPSKGKTKAELISLIEAAEAEEW